MKRKILAVFLLIGGFLLVPPATYAQTAASAGPVPICQLEEIILNLFNLIIAVTPFIGLGVLLFGAVIWMTASADPQKMQKAQSTLTFGVIGLVVGLSAVLIVVAIESFLIATDSPFRWSEDGAAALVRVQICADDAVSGGDGGEDGEGAGQGESCVGDSSCASGYYCDGTSETCWPARSIGQSCNRPAQCQDGCCSEGVCRPSRVCEH